jgi:hypothetical protein
MPSKDPNNLNIAIDERMSKAPTGVILQELKMESVTAFSKENILRDIVMIQSGNRSKGRQLNESENPIARGGSCSRLH